MILLVALILVMGSKKRRKRSVWCKNWLKYKLILYASLGLTGTSYQPLLETTPDMYVKNVEKPIKNKVVNI